MYPEKNASVRRALNQKDATSLAGEGFLRRPTSPHISIIIPILKLGILIIPQGLSTPSQRGWRMHYGTPKIS